MCDRRFAWLKDAAMEMGPIPLGALRPSQCCMRDLGTGIPGPDMSLCGECRMQHGLALDHLEASDQHTEKTAKKILAISIDRVMEVGAPSSPAPTAHRFAAAGLDRAPKSVTKSYQDR